MSVPACVERASCVLLAVLACAGCRSDSTRSVEPIVAEPPAPVVPELPLDPERGEVVALVQRTRSAVATDFEARWVAKLREAAYREGARLRVVDAGVGAPAEVGITPLLVYQNYRGRSIYQGRYTDPLRFVQFVRIARQVPQADEPLRRERALVARMGRSRVALQIKVTPLRGAIPEGFRAAELEAAARAAIAAALPRFEAHEIADLGRADRTFYLDFHPYRDEAGDLILSSAVFSQFHCDIPVFTSDDRVSRAAWVERASAFGDAARTAEAAVAAVIASPRTGDGFDPVAEAVALRSWEETGLALPAAPEAGATPAPGQSLPREWRFSADGGSSDPAVLYQFAPPLESYAGEARDVRCSLRFDETLALASLRGSVEVATRSVTMGDPELDRTVHGGLILNVEHFPKAEFVVEAVEPAPGSPASLAWGRPAEAILHGSFRMKGVPLPIRVAARLEASVDAAGTPRLDAHGRFEIRLREPFGVNGPEGPYPSRDTVQFFFRFRLGPR